MKKLFFYIFLLTNAFSKAQNLVPNGGFETYSSLPNSAYQYSRAVGWSNCNGFGSPDYFHLKGSGEAKLPNCFVGKVYPHSDSGVMGFITWTGELDNFREYISCGLKSELNKGSTYKVTFYVTNGTVMFYGGYGSDNLGVIFSTSPLKQISDSVLLNVTPHYSSPDILYNTQWQKVEFTFKSDSAYKYLTIGNFINDLSTQSKDFYGVRKEAYYYIDDISVVLTKEVSVWDYNRANTFAQVNPNPCSKELLVKVNSDEFCELILFNALGKIIIKENFTKSIDLALENFTNGIYFYEIKTKLNVIKKGRILKY